MEGRDKITMEETNQVTRVVREKLTRENYSMWSYQMENLFMGKYVWGYITSVQGCPQVGDEPNKEIVEVHMAWQAQVEAYKKWTAILRKVMDFIMCQQVFHIAFKEGSITQRSM